MRGSGLPHADKEQAVSAVAGRSGEVAGVRAVGRSWRRAGMAIFSGLGVTAAVPEAWRAILNHGRLLPLAGPAEVARLAGYGNLRPGPAERAGDTGQRVGQRAARGFRAVLSFYLHGKCSLACPLDEARRVVPGWDVTLGSSLTCFGRRLGSLPGLSLYLTSTLP